VNYEITYLMLSQETSYRNLSTGKKFKDADLELCVEFKSGALDFSVTYKGRKLRDTKVVYK
jgi:hypothetical protein